MLFYGFCRGNVKTQKKSIESDTNKRQYKNIATENIINKRLHKYIKLDKNIFDK